MDVVVPDMTVLTAPRGRKSGVRPHPACQNVMQLEEATTRQKISSSDDGKVIAAYVEPHLHATSPPQGTFYKRLKAGRLAGWQIGRLAAVLATTSAGNGYLTDKLGRPAGDSQPEPPSRWRISGRFKFEEVG